MNASSLAFCERAAAETPPQGRAAALRLVLPHLSPELGDQHRATLLLTLAGVYGSARVRRQRLARDLVLQGRIAVDELASALLLWLAAGRKAAWICAVLARDPSAVRRCAAAPVDLGPPGRRLGDVQATWRRLADRWNWSQL